MLRVLLRFAPLALALSLTTLAHAAVTGEIKGKVTDDAGKALAGVTVVVTSPALQGEQAELTDVDGYYLITQLPPGTYVVRFFYEAVAKARFERQNVIVSGNKTVMVNARIKTKEAKVETFTITERAPAVDVGTTNVGTTLTPEVVQNIPTGRNYEGVLGLTPGASGDYTGMGFSGATGLENSYLIDGVNSTGAYLGNVVANLPIDFAQEVQVLTGGYNAEWGRATGGLVNIITKQGSNEFHGSAWTFTGTRLADPRTVERLNQALTRNVYSSRACPNQFRSLADGGSSTGALCLDMGADVGGPLIKDKLWFYVAFMPQISWQKWDRGYRMVVEDAANPGAPAYDPSRTSECPSYLKDRGLCAGRPAPYLMRDISKSPTYSRQAQTYNFQTKFTYRLNPDNEINLMAFGAPSPKAGGSDPAAYVGQIDGAGMDQQNTSYDVSLRYLGKFLSRKLQVEASVGYHREQASENPREPDVAAVRHAPTRTLSDYNLPGSTEFPLQCADADPTDGYVPCPVQSFRTGGYGYYTRFTADRINLLLKVTGYFRLAGHHAVKAGYDPQATYLDHLKAYTGNYFYEERSPSRTFGGRLRTIRGFNTPPVNGACPSNAIAQVPFWNTDLQGQDFEDQTCIMPSMSSKTHTIEHHAFLQDQWSILPNLTVNYGVRWEGFQIYGADNFKGLQIMNNWAPRVGLIYDFTGTGKSKLYGSYGRFFESVPLDINERAFSIEGGIGEYFYFPTAAAMYAACGNPNVMNPSQPGCKSTNPISAPGVNGIYRTSVATTKTESVPGLKAQRSDEVVVGFQYEVVTDLVLGASYHKRWLGAILEDVSPDYAVHYYIANPGFIPSLSKIENEIAALQGKTDPESLARLDELKGTLRAYRALGKFPKAKRDYNAFDITAAKRFSKTWYLNAAYVYSRSIGNYPGLYQDTNGQSDPNITSAFDNKDLLVNMNGPLPQDARHSILVSGYKSWKLFSSGTLVTGLTGRAQEGYPINVLGPYPFYGDEEVFVLPRGSAGRTPWVYAVDLALRYQQKLSKTMTLAISVDLFNIFNLHQVTAVNEQYALDDVQPINHGRVADLRHLKGYDGTTPITHFFNYANATAYQTPIAGRFGARLTW
ncbi:MAG: TonB-dependent receptor [Deltaproteobacteria bacterium]|nr:TonB-dependent receptor [Deltaproteobacteria bacterium]